MSYNYMGSLKIPADRIILRKIMVKEAPNKAQGHNSAKSIIDCLTMHITRYSTLIVFTIFFQSLMEICDRNILRKRKRKQEIDRKK